MTTLRLNSCSGSAISRYAEDQFNTNIDHRITEKNWLSARFFSANQPSTSALPTFKGSGANVPGFGTDQQQNNRVVVLQDLEDQEANQVVTKLKSAGLDVSSVNKDNGTIEGSCETAKTAFSRTL